MGPDSIVYVREAGFMKFQKGQSILEFAFILPFFLFILYFVFYLCAYFSDYLYLSSIVRDSARSASVISIDDYRKTGYSDVYKSYSDAKLPLNFYEWSPNNRNDFDISYVQSSGNVQVKAWAKITENTSGSFFVHVVNNLGKLIGSDKDVTESFDLKITYEMRSENRLEQ